MEQYKYEIVTFFGKFLSLKPTQKEFSHQLDMFSKSLRDICERREKMTPEEREADDKELERKRKEREKQEAEKGKLTKSYHVYLSIVGVQGLYYPPLDQICARFGGIHFHTEERYDREGYGTIGFMEEYPSPTDITTFFLVGASLVKNRFYEENKIKTEITYLESMKNNLLIDAFRNFYRSECEKSKSKFKTNLETKLVNFDETKYWLEKVEK